MYCIIARLGPAKPSLNPSKQPSRSPMQRHEQHHDPPRLLACAAARSSNGAMRYERYERYERYHMNAMNDVGT